MAEIDFDEDENEDENAGDEGDDAASSGVSRNRTLIIAVVVGAVVLVAGALFAMRFFGEKPDVLQPSGVSQNLSSGPGRQPSPPKKKDKKKIKYVKLYDLPQATVTDVLKELSFNGIDFTTEQRGKNFTVLVDEDEIGTALNLLAVKGLPSSGSKGYALLDSGQTLGVTEFDKRVRFVRALSGELEIAIIQFDMVENAKVQIVLPEQRLFAVTQPPVTASILIRKKLGEDMTDDVVFSIIQLVANAVENLQQENVSVIDTEGHVLSNGLFERMALREAGLVAEPVEPPQPTGAQEPSPDNGNPIIPSVTELKKWYELKQRYEKSLEKKATKQLVGVLPASSYRVAITSELGPIEDGEIVDIRRLTTSIVVDNSRDDLFLDAPLKKQIFSTVAAAIGYVKGRDTIQLNKADFNLLTDAERNKLEAIKKSKSIWGRIKRFALIPLIPIGLGFAFIYGRRMLRRRRDEKALESVQPEPKFDELATEIESDKKWNDIKDMAEQEPEILAKIMEGWLAEESNDSEDEERVNEEEEVEEGVPV